MRENPWLTLWIQPRITIRKLIETQRNKHIYSLAILNGLLGSISWLVASSNPALEKNKFSTFFVISVLILGCMGGLINLYLGAFLYRIVGSWMGGQGSFQDIKCAVGWSNYPYLVSGILGLIAILLTPVPILQFPFLFFKILILIWGFIIFLKVIGEAHRFSAWKSLLAVILAMIILFVVVLTITFIFTNLSKFFFSKPSHVIKI